MAEMHEGSDSMTTTNEQNFMNISHISSDADLLRAPTQLLEALSDFEKQSPGRGMFVPFSQEIDLQSATSCENLPNFPSDNIWTSDGRLSELHPMKSEIQFIPSAPPRNGKLQRISTDDSATPKLLDSNDHYQLGFQAESSQFEPKPFFPEMPVARPKPCNFENLFYHARTSSASISSPGRRAVEPSPQPALVFSPYDQIELSSCADDENSQISGSKSGPDDVDIRIQRKQQILTKLIPGQAGAENQPLQQDDGRRWPFPELRAPPPGEMPARLQRSCLVPARDARIETLVCEARACSGYETRFLCDALLFTRNSYE